MGTPGLLVSAAHKSSGKTTVTLGLAAALALRGHLVQPFKKGPDYIDPMWLSLAAGRACVNLDPMLMARAEIDTCFAHHGAGAGLRLVEGNKGLYDGLALDGSNSNAALAKQLGLPVLLVLDARGMTRGIAPLILGYQAFDRDIRIGGVILNRLGGSRHEAKLRAVIEHYTDVPVLGAVQNDPRLELVERHLGLMPDREIDDALARVHSMGEVIAAQVDLPRILTLAATATTASPPTPERPRPPQRDRLRIGVARDKAFGFYYPDDLAALEAEGATLVPLDTLHDSQLPPLDGLFIGGGFPELFMAELEANVSLRTQLHRAIADGLPVFAECGGLMYLGREIEWDGERQEMAGLVPGKARRGEVRVVSYVHGRLARDCALGSAGEAIMGHEFHHSEMLMDEGVDYAIRLERGRGIKGGWDGVCQGNMVASYTHIHSASFRGFPANFLGACKARQWPSP